MANPFVHVELETNDVAKAKRFYGELFEWKMEDVQVPSGAYTLIRVGEGTGGGLMKNPMPNSPSMWLAYVEVDDIDAATRKAASLGAQVIAGPPDLIARFVAEPLGRALGVPMVVENRPGASGIIGTNAAKLAALGRSVS